VLNPWLENEGIIPSNRLATHPDQASLTSWKEKPATDEASAALLAAYTAFSCAVLLLVATDGENIKWHSFRLGCVLA